MLRKVISLQVEYKENLIVKCNLLNFLISFENKFLLIHLLFSVIIH